MSKDSVSDFLLARICVQGVERMAPLILAQTDQLVDEMLECERQMEPLRQHVTDLLHRVVADGMDRDHTRFAINLRRDIFNGRKLKYRDDYLKSIYAKLGSEETATFDAFFQLSQANSLRRQTLEPLYSVELQHATEYLQNEFCDRANQEFLQGLAVASPDFAATLNSKRSGEWKLGTNTSKSAFAYYQRAIMKTSPLSMFTQLAVATYEKAESLSTVLPRRRSSVRWSRAAVTSLLIALAGHPSLRHAFRFRVTDLIIIDGHVVAIRPKYLITGGFAWKQTDTLFNNHLIPTMVALADRLGPSFSISEMESALGTGLSASSVSLTVRLLLQQNLVVPIAPYALTDESPLDAMATLIERCEGEHETLCAQLRELEKIRNNFIAIDSVQRVNATQCARARWRTLLSAFDQRKVEVIDKTNLMYEDVRSEVKVGDLGLYVKEDLLRLLDLVRPEAYEMGVYREFVRQFKEHFGVGRQVPFLSFAMHIVDSEARYTRMIREGLRRDAGTDAVASRGPVHVTVYFQLAARDEQAVRDGDYLLVVNKVTGGRGSVFARFAPLFEELDYGRKVAAWIEAGTRGAKGLEMPIAGDWSNLQEDFGILRDGIRWVGDVSHEDSRYTMDISDLELSHDVTEDTLRFVTSEGEHVMPVYLGTVPEHLSAGLTRVILTLIHPSFVRSSFGINPKPWEIMDCPEDVMYMPRRTSGRLILNRSRWVVPFRKLWFLLDPRLSTLYIMVYLMRFFLAHEIPSEVFVMAEQTKGAVQLSKPSWLHPGSPHAVTFLKRHVRDDDGFVVFEEALPSRHQAWLADATGVRFNSEFMALGRLEVVS